MSNATADPAITSAGDSPQPVLARSVGVVMAWHVVPAIEVSFGIYVLTRVSRGCVDTCGWDGLILVAHMAMLGLSLVISAAILGTLVLVSRKRPRLRRVALLGNVSAITGMLLSVASIYYLYLWVGTLRAG